VEAEAEREARRARDALRPRQLAPPQMRPRAADDQPRLRLCVQRGRPQSPRRRRIACHSAAAAAEPDQAYKAMVRHPLLTDARWVEWATVVSS
jgi:hypothetical protein